MVNSLITPELVLEVAEASKDYVITQEEFGNIIVVIGSIIIGIFTFYDVMMLLNSITKESVKGEY